ncbi:tetratricopeptide repeat protein [Thermoflexibacter ruber]|uniref:TPR repeat-containing protein n=1 Tax=Thermoflexibacter ruber TaxID=1003 RepID=A0A1I2JCH1_9BACT|nr:tetratricopeptide repeat protein [Thermoflexibacter ruber]SFF52224.1 TPR repeat-containing protein [Thermoflexibacter ruber]
MKKELYWLIVLLAIVLVVMSPALQNEFVNWDDEIYITKNEVIKKTPFSNLGEIFTYKINGFSVPLTLLSFQVEHYFFGLNPFPYHLNNLLLHLVNVFLIYLFVKHLTMSNLFLKIITPTNDSKKTKPNNPPPAIISHKTINYTAFFVALLFGIHPMNVESVAWATERKDLLYTFFALLAIYHYQQATAQQTLRLADKKYWLSLLFFLLSLLAKPQAIFLPILLLLIDYLKDRKIQFLLLWEKIPYFIISLLGGLYLLINVGTKVSAKTQDYDFWEKILFSCYQIGLYLTKFFFPFRLSNFYEYPIKVEGWYPIIFYIIPLILLGLAILLYWKFRNNKVVIFGVLFYFFNIFIFLQIFSVNTAIAYERFNYLAYNGLFFIVVVHLQKVKFTDYLWIGTLAYLAILGFLSFERCKVWQNNVVFFADMAKKNPNDIDANKIALKNTGDALMEKKQFIEAIEKFNQALGKDIKYEQAYLGRAFAYFQLGRYQEAINDYSHALALELTPQNRIETIFNRGTCLMNLKMYEQAINDFSSLIAVNPANVPAYLNRAYCLLNLARYEEAERDYRTVLQIEPSNAMANSQIQTLRQAKQKASQ